jgi:two-component system, LytTR family, response regulator
MKLRALIVDDEPPARSKIRKFLEARQDVELIGEAADGVEAITKILELRPGLVFLDIQMPRGDGFDVLREIYPEHKPLVIFTTAYDAYAIRAFEVEAIDYLLKPFTADRFHGAVDRAMRNRQSPLGLEDKLVRLLEDLRGTGGRVPRVLVRSEGRTFFVKASDIDWIEAEEKYVFLHTRSARLMIRQSIGVLEAQLASASFVRIHRSHLINLEALQEVVPWAHGDCVAILKSGARLNVGRNYKDRLFRAMGASASAPAPTDL